jgi:transcriptional regulator with XRE-family HTH domain
MSQAIPTFRRLRFELGDLSLRAFATLLRTDYPMLSRVERGEQSVTLPLLTAMRDNLGITLDEADAVTRGGDPGEFARIVAKILTHRGARENEKEQRSDSAGPASIVDAAAGGNARSVSGDGRDVGRLSELPGASVENRARISAGGSKRAEELGQGVPTEPKEVHPAR